VTKKSKKQKKKHKGVFFVHVCHMADGKFILILQLENGKWKAICLYKPLHLRRKNSSL
jgi:hypothetical protein